MSKEKIVFVIGAGFSAPASLPVQDRIIQKMIQPLANDFLSYSPEPENVKFLVAYINVGLYLLQNYTPVNCSEFVNAFSKLELDYKYDSIVKEGSPSIDERYNELIKIRENIRKCLKESKIRISLEDVFTSFDKTYQNREFFHNYSYQNADEIKESITRLFVYYFAKCCNDHTYDNKDYLAFFSFLKKCNDTTVISTNWDVLAEEYLMRNNIKYDLSLNDEYYIGKDITKPNKKRIKLIKLHGSINWFRCLNCGTINILENSKCGDFLFDDLTAEECKMCKQKRKEDMLLQSQLITPTMMKSLNSQLYNNLWAAARKALSAANHVVFVGYSLPIADFDFRFMLQQSIPNNAIIDVVLYHNDNPDQTEQQNLKDLLPEKRYRDLFSKNKLNFFYDGFGEFFSKELL